ncbi:MAG: DUF1549 domain-containing protein, partial [Acidobacteria bacterium]|nr:DUF1549 domain-containing protein [Acidobacteriota bacterium]
MFTLLSGLLLLAQDDPASIRAVSVIETKCQQCHSAKTRMGGIQLSTSSEVKAVADRLRAAIAYTGKIKMPPGGPLPAEDADAIQKWLASGATWTASKTSVPTHWAFQKVVKPKTGNSIDSFVAAKLAEKSLKMAPEADKRTLIRRATFDLHGLPPSQAEIDAFVADTAPDAYAKLIDRLLASPRYGEKWGLHWLDLARYGDTSGFEQDPYLLYSWRYRDYVVKSFNDDKPYDRFILETVAGDEIFPEDPEAQQGTGFYTVGANRDMLYKVEDINREESLTDFTDTTSSVFLGLTAGCARCHDHKFDPIPQRDYYRLQAVFAPFLKTRVFLH